VLHKCETSQEAQMGQGGIHQNVLLLEAEMNEFMSFEEATNVVATHLEQTREIIEGRFRRFRSEEGYEGN
jgi:hypothetical protein